MDYAHPRLQALMARAIAQAGNGPDALGLVYPCDALALDAARRIQDSGMARPLLIGPASLIAAAADAATPSEAERNRSSAWSQSLKMRSCSPFTIPVNIPFIAAACHALLLLLEAKLASAFSREEQDMENRRVVMTRSSVNSGVIEAVVDVLASHYVDADMPPPQVLPASPTIPTSPASPASSPRICTGSCTPVITPL
jgi:hypothetical protein